MGPHDIASHLNRIEYPIDHDALIARLGDHEIRAPTGRTTTVGEALGIAEDRRYGSATEAHETIVGNLGEAHIGRKYYDDRGGVAEDRHRTQSF